MRHGGRNAKFDSAQTRIGCGNDHEAMLSDPDQEIIFGPSRDRRAGVSLVLYIVGCVLLILGLAYGGILLSVLLHWVTVCALVLLGFSLLNAPKILHYKNADDVIVYDLDDEEACYYHRPRTSLSATAASAKSLPQTVLPRRQKNARQEQENQQVVQGVERGETFPAVGDWPMHRRHVADPRGGIQKGVAPH